MIDTAGLTPLSFVTVVDTTVSALSVFSTHARMLFDASAAVSTPFYVAALMVRCFGVWYGCGRVLGLPIGCPVAMIVVRRQIQQHIVIRIRVWRDIPGDDIGYDFEYTMRAAAVHFGFSTINTGYWNTG